MIRKKVYARAELCTGCQLCAAACSVIHFGENNPRRSGIIIKQDLFERYELQYLCRHCDEPRCIDACIAGNIRVDENGLVQNNPEECVGCWSCLMVCPFDSIRQARIKDKTHLIALKCDGCPDREIPACVAVCPTQALAYEF